MIITTLALTVALQPALPPGAAPAPARRAPIPLLPIVADEGEEQLLELMDAYDDAMQAFRDAYGEAETDEERQELYAELYPQPADYAERFMALADAHPDTDVGFRALAWVANRVRGDQGREAEGQGRGGRKGQDALARRHAPPAAQHFASLRCRVETFDWRQKFGELLTLSLFCEIP